MQKAKPQSFVQNNQALFSARNLEYSFLCKRFGHVPSLLQTSSCFSDNACYLYTTGHICTLKYPASVTY